MKRSLGIYLMFAGILMGFYLVFNVYLPGQVAMSQVMSPSPPVGEGRGEGDIDREPILLASYQRPQTKVTPLFSIPVSLKDEVEFWKKIYSIYTTDQAVLHDPNNLSRIYEVIALQHCDEPPAKECSKTRDDQTQSARDHLLSLVENSDNINIRAQIGQKDRFIAGIAKADGILSEIEGIFESYDIPKEISRLAFVESMFNGQARSRSGAVGIWQLMPSTARIFGLKVSKGHDERLDPIKSTHVAAKHLVRDFNRLGSWPLAINAYNAGPARLADAVASLQTGDIAKIIKKYEHPTFGFASRNFYPCFLAVLDIYEHRDIYFNGTGEK